MEVRISTGLFCTIEGSGHALVCHDGLDYLSEYRYNSSGVYQGNNNVSHINDHIKYIVITIRVRNINENRNTVKLDRISLGNM